MIYLKSFGLGFLMYLVTTFLAATVTGLTAGPDLSNAEFTVRIFYTMLFVWTSAVGAFLLMNIRKIKVTLRAFVARSVFLWGPIGIGWFLMVSEGKMQFFLLGVFISSTLFWYEVLVMRQRAKSVR